MARVELGPWLGRVRCAPQEELNELKEAIAQNDLVEVADALADLQYVLSGAVHEFGMSSVRPCAVRVVP